MSTSRKALFTLAALGLAAFAAHPVSAQSLITNGNFANPVAAGSLNNFDYTTGQQIPNWTDTFSTYNTATGVGNSGYGVQKDSPYATASDPDGGGQFLYINTGFAYQTISASSFTVGTAYTLSGDVLHRFDNYSSGVGTIALYGVNADGSPNFNNLLASATSTPATAGNYSAISTGPYFGGTSAVDVVLSGPSGTNQADYDSIRLLPNTPASAAPEPAQIGMLALAVLGLGALAVKARRRTTAAQTA